MPRPHAIPRLIGPLLAIVAVMVGCSDRAIQSDRSARMELMLQLPKGASVEQVTSGSARFISDMYPMDSSMVAELTVANGTYEGRLNAVPGGPGELTVNLFDESGGLVYQGSSRIMVIPGRLNEVSVRLQGPPQSIDNSVVYMHFNHSRGAIDSLVFKPGANADLLDQANNIELGQYGLGGVIGRESGTTLRRFEVRTGSATIEYSNPQQYGSKTFSIRWGAAVGVEVDMEYDITSDRQVTVGCSWLPGGDADLQRDSLVIYDGSGRLDAFPYTYPGQSVQMYSGEAAAAGMLDSDHDVIFGYRFAPSRNVVCRQSGSADGPYITLGTGAHSLSFAIKDELGFVIWSVGRD